MKFIKTSSIKNPKISLILLDWSVRESFHLLHYLSKQNVARDLFEVILIEYYSTESETARKFTNQIDTWAILEMPVSCYYHKHLMYNAGIILSQGQICVICDSDAMVKENFIKTILTQFEETPNIILHLDQFRNTRRDFYPFNYPNFEEVLGEGCINNVEGKTIGTTDTDDLLHKRNYGACMCAPRAAMIAIGGADEYLDYVGHICGPYDMTFRLINYGLKEIWHESEFLYHTWHPGQAGEDNYLGPHDGRHMSTTALDALLTGRVIPLVENKAITSLRENTDKNIDKNILNQLINPTHFYSITKQNLNNLALIKQNTKLAMPINYFGFKILKINDKYLAISLNNTLSIKADSLEEIKNKITAIYSLNIIYRRKLISYILLLRSYTMRVIYLSKILLKYVFISIFSLYKTLIVKLYSFIKNKISHKIIPATKSLKNKLLYLHGIETYSTNSIATLIDGLFLLLKQHDKKTLENSFVLLVQNEQRKQYLSFLSKLKLIPNIKIMNFDNKKDVEEFLGNIKNYQDKKLIISSSLYINFYAQFNTCSLQKNIFII